MNWCLWAAQSASSLHFFETSRASTMPSPRKTSRLPLLVSVRATSAAAARTTPPFQIAVTEAGDARGVQALYKALRGRELSARPSTGNGQHRAQHRDKRRLVNGESHTQSQYRLSRSQSQQNHAELAKERKLLQYSALLSCSSHLLRFVSRFGWQCRHGFKAEITRTSTDLDWSSLEAGGCPWAAQRASNLHFL